MPEFPPIPTWDEMHPLIIHFPIALLLLSPLFVLISAILAPPRNRPFLASALLVLWMGTGSLLVAHSTGKAAAELAERGGRMDAVLEIHEELASESIIVFGVLSVILLGIYVAPLLVHRETTRLMSTFLPAAFLALYSVGVLFLVNTAHAGGRLVHEFGVHAVLPSALDPAEASAPAASAPTANRDD